jgi:hypothetical protein
MDPRWRYKHGVRPTLRHLMILTVAVALLSAVAAPMVRHGPNGSDLAQATSVVIFAPALLGLLVFMMDRPGPVKNWLAGLLLQFTYPVVVVWADGLAYEFGQGRRLFWPLVVLNALTIPSLLRIVNRLPERCPQCGLRALLPLGRFNLTLRWCASCGHSVPRGEKRNGIIRP